MFSNLMGKIFAHATVPVQPSSPTSEPAPVSISPAYANTPEAAAAPVPVAATPAPIPEVISTPVAAVATPPNVDVTEIMNGLSARSSEHLVWKRSIVDMLKLLDMDSSLTARKELAKDLNYSGDEHDSAAMNEWLHKEVLQKLADNGGKVPAELLG